MVGVQCPAIQRLRYWILRIDIIHLFAQPLLERQAPVLHKIGQINWRIPTMFRTSLRTTPLTLAVIAVLILLVAACGATPTATAVPVPPTATKAPQPAAATAAPATATKATAAPTTAAATATTAPAAATVSFSKDVLPLFQKNCTRCHGGGSPRQGLSLESYQAVMKGSNNGAVVVAGNPDKSPLYTLVKSGTMPFGGTKLADADIQKISDWIKAGAANN